MDLKTYFRKIREVEATIAEPQTFVTSLETPDGGKAGVVTEVPREVAAKMIVEGRAAHSTKVERERFLERQAVIRSAAQRVDLAQRLQLTIVSDDESTRPQSVLSSPGSKK